MLLDSNLIIYAAEPRNTRLREWIAGIAPFVSAISLVEVLGYHRLNDDDRVILQRFFSATTILPVSHDVIQKAIVLRQSQKMSLGDALIAASALVHALPLATHNVADFRDIDGLDVLDPLANGNLTGADSND
jgi:toxin FitB